jgi:hypothetical protein
MMTRLVLTAIDGDLVDASEAVPIKGSDLLFAEGWFAINSHVPRCRSNSAVAGDA